MQIIEYQNLPNCVSLSNNDVEIIVTTDVGPRVLHYGFTGGENVLGLHPNVKTTTALGEFKPYGGHRLWIAPENMPNSYAPDNAKVEYTFDETRNSIRLIQLIETITNTQKEIVITLNAKGSGATVKHKITNKSAKTIEMAAWALTIMRGGGVCEIPNEPYKPYGAENLLPVRNLSLWSYTDLTDSRWELTKDFVRLKVDARKSEPQKIGILNRQGWAKYRVGNLEFTKHFDFVEGAAYPDMNANIELYTAGDFVELETLSPLRRIAPDESIEHIERWQLDLMG